MVEKSKYTVYPDEEIDRHIEKDLGIICQRILHYPKQFGIKSIILTGGFGRGEGSIIKNGSIKPLNDYDIMIITSRTFLSSKPLKDLSKLLAKELNIDFVDISRLHSGKLGNLRPTMLNYDMKYGSQIIYGDESVLEKIPDFKPEDVPLWEGIKLLFNRMAGILGGFSVEYLEKGLSKKEERYLINQINHMVIAWVDSLNLSKRKYSHLYREKLEIFMDLYEPEFKEIFGSEILEYSKKAIKFKLTPSYEMWDEILNELFYVTKITRDVFEYVMQQYLRKELNLSEIADEYIKYERRRIYVLKNLYYFFKLYRNQMSDLRAFIHINYPFHHLVYINLPYILFSIDREGGVDRDLLKVSEKISKKFLKLEVENESNSKKWESIRKKAFDVWNILCH